MSERQGTIYYRFTSSDSWEPCEALFAASSYISDHSFEKNNVNNESGGSNNAIECFNTNSSEESYYCCGVCFELFENGDNLISHLRTHMVEKQYNCKVKVKPLNINDLRKYKRTQATKKDQTHEVHFNKFSVSSNSSDQPFFFINEKLCSICLRQFSNGLASHLRTHMVEKQYNCKVYVEPLTSGDLKKYMESRPPLKVYPRRVNKSTPSRYLSKQTRISPRKKLHCCSLCHKQFQNNDLLTHLWDHMFETKFNCQVHVTPLSSGDLKKYTRTQITEGTNSCDVCDQQFSGKEYLLKHLKNFNHHVRAKPYKCAICDDLLSNCTEHGRNHIGEKPYKRKLFHAHVSRSIQVNKHLKTDFADKPYNIEVCGNQFSQRSSLLKHSIIHTID